MPKAEAEALEQEVLMLLLFLTDYALCGDQNAPVSLQQVLKVRPLLLLHGHELGLQLLHSGPNV